MSRIALRLCIASVAVLTATMTLHGDEKGKDRFDTQLAMHAALSAGRLHIQRQEFEQAVAVLEKNIGLINGNREYLMALRDAYAGYIPQLQGQKRYAEMKVYQGRLAILEPSGRRAPVPRGKSEQDDASDPFDRNNAVAARKGRSLIEQAEEAFDRRQYEAAAELYARARQQSPDSVSGCAERWAYCRLYAVARAINRGDVAQAAALEREIREAVGLAPRLEGFAEDLLGRLRQPAAAPVEVRHTPRQNGGWARAETANFRIFHATDEATAEKIARVAEATRVSMTRKWFGEEPTNWSPRCDLYVYPTGQGYARATGAPPTAPGHSTIKQENGRVLERRIDLRGDDPNMLAGVLPHETTHVVLAGRFGVHYVPRWADEGMAVLSEPRERINLHLANLPKHRADGTLFGVAELMRLDNYPEARRVGPFYAQSVSLVDFLCRKKDPVTFARFVREGLDTNWESALRRHYGYPSSSELEREWKQHAFDAAAVASVAQKRR